MLGLGGDLALGGLGIPAAPEHDEHLGGPAGRSIATSRETSSFASFTYAFPGPTILSTAAI